MVVLGRNEARLAKVAGDLRATGATVVSAIGDLATNEGAEHVADVAMEELGGIDVLVNNAGGASEGENKSWFQVPLEDWVATVPEERRGRRLRLIHRLVPGMKERGWGRGHTDRQRGRHDTHASAQPDYGPAKAAMANMSMGLSKALTGTGITVNTVSPGMIMTEGLMDFLMVFADKRGWGDDTDRAAEYILKGCGQTVNRIPGQVEGRGLRGGHAGQRLARRVHERDQHPSGRGWHGQHLLTRHGPGRDRLRSHGPVY